MNLISEVCCKKWLIESSGDISELYSKMHLLCHSEKGRKEG